MNVTKYPHMTAPCKDCPFTKGCPEGWLGGDRAKEIAEAKSFVCHKTAHGKKKDRKQCAGHMILKGEQNEYVLFARLYRIATGLKGHDLVFETEQAFVDHHTEE